MYSARIGSEAPRPSNPPRLLGYLVSVLARSRPRHGAHSESCLSARERSRQPEPWEHALVEAGDRADPVAGEGEDVEAGPVADAAGGGPNVDPERRLAIRPRRHEIKRPARAEDAGVEAGHDVAALVFEGNGRHRDEDIGGEQGDQRVDIAGLVRADEPCGERLFGG